MSEENRTLAFLQVKHDELERLWERLTESYEAFFMDEKSEVSEDSKDGVPLQYETAADLHQNFKAKQKDRIANKSITDQSVANSAVARQSRSGLR